MLIEEFKELYHLERYNPFRMLGSRENHQLCVAEDTNRNCEVVIRVLQFVGKKGFSEFEQELEIIINIDYRYILPVIDCVQKEINGDIHFLLVTPFRQEASLVQWIDDHIANGRVPLNYVKDFVQQAADALEYIHEQGICHGNVKLSQFLINPQKGELDKLDLQLSGLGVVTSGSDFSTTSQSPTETEDSKTSEQKSGEIACHADLHALAVMTYELITGDTPIERNSDPLKKKVCQAQKEGHISKPLSEVLQKAFSDEQGSGFNTVSEFKEAFCKAVDCKAVEQNSFSAENLPKRVRVLAGVIFWFILTLILSFFIGGVLNALNMIPAFVVSISSSLGGSLTTLWGFVSGIFAGIGATYVIRAWKSLIIPFIIATGLSLVTVLLLTVGDLRLATFTDPYTHQATNIYSDPLVDNSKGYNWNVGPGTHGSCSFVDGAYVADQRTGNFLQQCNASARNFNDFVYEVQMKIIRGTCGELSFEIILGAGTTICLRFVLTGTIHLYLI